MKRVSREESQSIGRGETVAQEFSRLRYKEAVFRERLFYGSVGLIVLGFVLQVIGALPGS